MKNFFKAEAMNIARVAGKAAALGAVCGGIAGAFVYTGMRYTAARNA
jgi:hypothetical protein